MNRCRSNAVAGAEVRQQGELSGMLRKEVV